MPPREAFAAPAKAHPPGQPLVTEQDYVLVQEESELALRRCWVLETVYRSTSADGSKSTRRKTLGQPSASPSSDVTIVIPGFRSLPAATTEDREEDVDESSSSGQEDEEEEEEEEEEEDMDEAIERRHRRYEMQEKRRRNLERERWMHASYMQRLEDERTAFRRLNSHINRFRQGEMSDEPVEEEEDGVSGKKKRKRRKKKTTGVTTATKNKALLPLKPSSGDMPVVRKRGRPRRLIPGATTTTTTTTTGSSSQPLAKRQKVSVVLPPRLLGHSPHGIASSSSSHRGRSKKRKEIFVATTPFHSFLGKPLRRFKEVGHLQREEIMRKLLRRIPSEFATVAYSAPAGLMRDYLTPDEQQLLEST